MGREQTISDAEVIGRVLAGWKDEFGVLVRRHLPALQTLAYSKTGNQADAEEVTQEAFLKGFRYLDRLKDPARFRAWMAMIVRNVAFGFLKKRPRPFVCVTDVPSSTYSMQSEIEGRDLRRYLREKIGQLDENHRDVLLLYYFGGLSTREIADLLSLSKDAVQKRLQRARDELGNNILAGLKSELGFEAPTDRHVARVMGAVSTMSVPWLSQGGGASVGTVSGATKAAADATTGVSVFTKSAVALFALAATVSAVLVFSRDSEPAPIRVAEASSMAMGSLEGEGLSAIEDMPESSEDLDGAMESEAVEEETAEVHPDPELSPRSIAPLGYPGTVAPDGSMSRVSGVVYDPSGTPLPGAKVWVARFGMQARDTREAVSDEEGAFALEVPPGQWMLQARKGSLGGEGDVGSRGQFITEEKGKPVEARVRMSRRGSVRGCIYDKATGKPVPGARIWTDSRALIEADEAGRYRIEGVRPNSHTMMVLAPGYKREYVLFCNVQPRECKVDVFLVPGRKVSGTVVDGSGRPLGHAWVNKLRNGVGCLGGDYEVCDEKGRFEYDGLPLGKDIRLRVWVPVYINQCGAAGEEIEGRSQRTMTIEAGDGGREVSDAVFVLDPLAYEEVRLISACDRPAPEAVVRGRVVDPQGKPVEHFKVLFQMPRCSVDKWMSMEVNESFNGYSFTDKDGVFAVTSSRMVPGIALRVVAVAEGYAEGVCDFTKAYPVEAPASPNHLTLQLSRPNRLRVRVSEAGGAGRPVADASVTLADWVWSSGQALMWRDYYEGASRTYTVRSDEEGWACFEGVSFHEGTVMVRKEGFGRRHVCWDAGEKVVSMKLAPECVVEGRAVNQNGRPLESGYIDLRNGGGEVYEHGNPEHDCFQRPFEEGGDGKFRFEGLPPGDYEVRVTWHGEGRPTTEYVHPDQAYDDAFQLEAGQSLHLSYPEDSLAGNPEGWKRRADAEDEALRSRMVGTWLQEHQLGARRIRNVLYLGEDDRYEYKSYKEGSGHPSGHAGVYQVLNGRLKCLTDEGKSRDWCSSEMPDRDSIVFMNGRIVMPAYKRVASLEEATRLGEQLAALPDPSADGGGMGVPVEAGSEPAGGRGGFMSSR